MVPARLPNLFFPRGGEGDAAVSGLVDLHIHLLPGLDDGPRSRAEALELARLAVEAGVGTAVCTPHLMVGRFDNVRSRVLPAVRRLQEALDAEGLPLRLLPGCEAYAHPSLPALHDAGELPTLGDGPFLLLELPWTALPPGLDELLFELQQRGLRPILAHPERYAPVQRQPDLVGRWVERGVLVQVNALHLAAASLGIVHRTAWRLLERGWVHLLASDAHSTRRPPCLGPLLERLAQEAGDDLAARARANAEAVVAGTPEALPPLPARRRRWRLPRWFGG